MNHISEGITSGRSVIGKSDRIGWRPIGALKWPREGKGYLLIISNSFKCYKNRRASKGRCCCSLIISNSFKCYKNRRASKGRCWNIISHCFRYAGNIFPFFSFSIINAISYFLIIVRSLLRH